MLTVYGLNQSEEWDQIVRAFPEYDVYWLSGYVKAFQIHGDGVPLLFYFDDGKTRGINVVMKRDVADDSHFSGMIDHGKYFDFASPYGYGGWLIIGEDKTSLFAAYEVWCAENGIISEFVRFHPVNGNHRYAEGFYEVVQLGNTVSMDLSSPETIWNNITSKNRNMIRKAEKNGIKVYNGRSPEIFETFRMIYNATMDKDEADSYYYFAPDFYSSICDDLPQNAQIFYAVWEDKVIAASIMLAANGRMNYHLSGSVREYSNMAPTNLILYKAALWGSENHNRSLYLGGGVGSSEDSLFKFKKAFYRLDDLPKFHIGKKIMNDDRYNELVSMRNNIQNEGFFPQYRG